MGRTEKLRWALIAVLAVAAVVSPFSEDLGLALFVVAAAIFVRWRRGRVFDREAKTDETRARPDR